MVIEIENVEMIKECFESLNTNENLNNKRYSIQLETLELNLYFTNFNQVCIFYNKISSIYKVYLC